MLMRSMLLLAALTQVLPAMADNDSTDPKAQAFIHEAQRLESNNDTFGALLQYEQAARADPKSSQANSAAALILADLLDTSSFPEHPQVREKALTLARSALAIDRHDAVAQALLRSLGNNDDQPAMTGTAAAEQALAEGNLLLQQKAYDQALQKYELAVQLDPSYPAPLLSIGNFHLQREDFPRAETALRRAVTLDPQSGAGWRFLADALIRQERFDEAQVAALSALAALPSAKTSWARLRLLATRDGQRLGYFSWRPATLPVPGKADNAAWLAYASANGKHVGDTALPAAAEVARWKKTAEAIIQSGARDKLVSQSLKDLLRFHQAGQLKAAVFALHYQESYRAEFEAWKKAEPGGLKHFIDAFHIGL
ncbi:Tetratricopeptide repeat-containing protein [Massilia sp. CF038]|nr:Tetratricopeptide repeat-containing protein [Massilia sp. CF038]